MAKFVKVGHGYVNLDHVRGMWLRPDGNWQIVWSTGVEETLRNQEAADLLEAIDPPRRMTVEEFAAAAQQSDRRPRRKGRK